MAGDMNDVTFEDTGCKFHPSCINCPEIPPLSMCVFDFPGYEKGWLQYKQIKHFLVVEKLTIVEVAARMNLRKRHIENILAKVERLVLV